MEIIGSGFLARHLRPLAESHPGTTVLAAGVPRHQLPAAAHDREAALVDAVAARCRRAGRRLVFFSTVSMYGSPGCRGREDEPVVPSTRYGRHKLDLEARIQDSGVRHLILRSAYVLGPHGPRHRLVPALIEQIRGGRVRVYSRACRDLVHVDDFMAVLDCLLHAAPPDQVVNVASGDCVDISEVVDLLERLLGTSAEREVVDGAAVSYRAAVDKLHRLVPEAAGLGFGPGYHRGAIERYLAAER